MSAAATASGRFAGRGGLRTPPAPARLFVAMCVWALSLRCATSASSSVELALRRPPAAALAPAVRREEFGPPASAVVPPSSIVAKSTVLVATLDGSIHAVDKLDGSLRWTWSSGSPLLSSTSYRPPESARETTPADSDLNFDDDEWYFGQPNRRFPHSSLLSEDDRLATATLGVASDEQPQDVEYILEPTAEGSLFMYRPGSRRQIEKLKFPIKDLVDKTPFWTVDGTVYLGSKTTSFFALNPETGELLEAYGDNSTARDGGKRIPGHSILFGRKEYKLSIRDRHGGRRWFITYAEFVSADVNDAARPPFLAYETPFVTDGGGGGVVSDVLTNRWERKFDSPAITVFDVFMSTAQTGLIVSKQPTDPELVRSLQKVVGERPQTAYVGHLNGQLYALSAAYYPLVQMAGRINEKSLLLGSTSRSAAGRGASPHESPFAYFSENGEELDCRHGHSSFPDCLVGTHGVVHNVMHVVDASRGYTVGGKADTADAPAPKNQSRTVEVAVPRIASVAYDILNSRGFGGASARWLIAVGAVGLTAFAGKWWTWERKNTRKPQSNPPGTGRRRRRGVLARINMPKSQSEGEKEAEAASAVEELRKSSEFLASARRTDVPRSADAESEVEEAKDRTPQPVGTKRKGLRRRGQGGRGPNGVGGEDQSANVLIASAVDSGAIVQHSGRPESTTPDSEVALPSSSGTVVNEPIRPVTTNPPSWPRLLTVSDSVLGYGSHGTVVYKGRFEDRDVAVKRLLLDFYDIAQIEVQLLRESDDHPHVVRYFYREECDRFMYIALELCEASLYDVIERPTPERLDLLRNLPAPKIIYQIASGLHHLHSLKIVHRDIKPQNVLIAGGRNNVHVASAAAAQLHSPHNGHKNSARALLSDFGLCKRLEHDQSSFNNMTHAAASAGAAGTVGWRAPECLLALGSGQQIVLDGDSPSSLLSSDDVPHGSAKNGGAGVRITKAIDIFSAGCLFYYVLSGGDHPFGERYERESNILKNRYDLNKLELLGPEGLEAWDLVERMISADAKLRPTASEILVHPYFWSPARRLAFLLDCSDRFEVECRDPPSPLLAALESRLGHVLGPGENWHRRLGRSFVQSLGKYRKYDPRSVRDLLRALRNKRHHYQDAPEALKRLFGPTAETFLAYFRTKFPNLFMHVYEVVRSEPKIRHEHLFRPYFETPV